MELDDPKLRDSKSPVTLGLLVKVAEMLTAKLKEQHEAFKVLSARLIEIEKQPFSYDGPHETGKVYDKGRFVTHDGSLWHCNYKTACRPGDGPAWTLAVKRGRDAK
ncbi:carbohydrate-binding family V/XII protein [Polaromonas sp. JS666]|uniref:carbohydrate-binding family V/XII protein n=1 Tax=Polaromonas sp. (strain JS666 / ATCC BAA-500) TaxID=296591 RepID=UPI0000463F71|nr:carbohydrate-binding family V/XII protein [Polaromonas sp. JS666]ABE42913.1 Carbohydrate-binding family V/XII [Polaromonas sp. JS666]